LLRDPYYSLTLDTLKVTGLTVEFEIEKSIKRTPNTAVIRVRNLSKEQRDHLSSLSVNKKAGTGKIRCELVAGYKDEYGLIFRGDLRNATHTREGATWITQVEGEDGGRSSLKARVNQTFPAGTPVATVVLACAAALGVGPGNLPSLTALLATRGGRTFPAGTVLSGQASEELHHLLASCGYTYSIQNGALQIQKAGKPLLAVGALLSEATGLVETPSVNPDGTVSAKTLIIPNIYPGARCVLASAAVQGQYQIRSIKYQGNSFTKDWYASLELKA
jgi:hypothetical protein